MSFGELQRWITGGSRKAAGTPHGHNGRAGSGRAARARVLDLSELEDRTLLSVSPAAAVAPKKMLPPPPKVAPLHARPLAPARTVQPPPSAPAPSAPVAPQKQIKLATPAAAAPVSVPKSATATAPTVASAVAKTVQAVRHELVIIDSSVFNAAQLVKSIRALGDPSRKIDVVTVSDNDGGLAAISRILAQYHDLSAVHFISHGTDHSVDLAGTWLAAGNLAANRTTIAGWKAALATGADLLFYGCDLGAATSGKQLLAALRGLTGANIAASTDATGHAASGGNWTLEYRLGTVRTGLPFNAALLDAWTGALKTYTVTTTADSGAGSLRDAITQANSQPGTDTITFNIGGGGVQTIDLLTALPSVTDAIIIDGTSQGGYAGTPLIVLNGTSAGAGTSGITISAGSSTVKGLVIENFGGFGINLPNGGASTIVGNYLGVDATGAVAAPNASGGIYINNSANNTIGGNTALLRNVISGNSGDGIDVFGPMSTGNTILGNYIGTNAAGTAALANNGYGVYAFAGAATTTIGGTAVGTGNVISGNAQYGVYVSDNTTTGTLIEGNYIGTNAAGTAAVSNGGWGVAVDNGAVNTTIGGTVAGAGNVISGNVNTSAGAGIGGIYVLGAGTTIKGNTIGMNAAKSAALGNGAGGAAFTAGVYVDSGSSGTTIGGTAAADANTIAGNAGTGLAVVGNGNRATIEGNAIYGNGALGIDLSYDGVTANHVGGPTAGPNGLLNYPVLTFASSVGGRTLIAGSLNGAASTTYRVEFFSSPSADPSGYGEGQVYLGFRSITTDASGNARFTVNLAATVTVGNVIAATATDPAGNTSEFSNAVSTANNILIVDTTSDTVDGTTTSIAALLANEGADAHISLREAILATNNTANVAGPDRIYFNIPGAGARIIAISSLLPVISDSVTIDGTTQPGYAGTPLVEVNGAAIAGGTVVISVGVSNTTIRGLALHGASNGNAIQINNVSGTVVQANYLGLSAAGTSAGDTAAGVVMTGSTNSVIGGTTAATRNIISGTGGGVRIESGGFGNVVEGNYIGTNVAGTAALANTTYGVLITAAPNNTIGGAAAGAGNVISGNTGPGVRISGAASTGNLVSGNYIGTNAAGTAAIGNSTAGVLIDTSANGNYLGTNGDGVNDAAEHNVISGNSLTEVSIQSASNNVIAGNYIGTNAAGTASLSSAADGILLNGATNTRIGTNADGTSDTLERNVVSGINGDGIDITGGTSGTVVAGNYIGTAADGTTALGNRTAGVWINGSSNNTIGGTAAGQGNIIANTTAGNGITIIGTSEPDPIEGNSIYGNSQLGIDLGNDGVTINDLGDGDSGPNGLKNFPVLTSADTNSTNSITIVGTINTAAARTMRIEFFASPTADPSGYGEGQQYLGFTTVTSDASGNAGFNTTLTAAVPLGWAITATTIDTTVNGDTSELSAAIFASHVNQAPTWSLPGAQTTNQDTSLVFSSGGGNAITAGDPDAAANPVRITLTATNGILTLSSTAGLTFLVGTGTNNATMQFTGTLANVNAALEGLTFDPTTGFSGAASVALTVSDQGNTGSGGAKSANGTINISVVHVNQIPAIGVPGAQSMSENGTLTFSSGGGNAITVSDLDSGGAAEQVTLSVSSGILTLSGTAGISVTAGANGSSTMTIQGTLAAINTALNGLSYAPTTYYFGPDALNIAIDDLGHTGLGGAQTSNASVAITVNHVNQAPTLSGGTGFTSINEDDTTNTGNLVSSLVSGLVADPDPGALSGVAIPSVDNSNGAWEFTLDGSTWLAIGNVTTSSARLLPADGVARIRFVPNLNYNGATGLTMYKAWDQTSGTAGGLADVTTSGGNTAFSSQTSGGNIVVFAVNDPPTVTVPPAQNVNENSSLTFSGGGGNAITVADVDAGGAQELVSLSVTSGTLMLSGTAGLTFVGGANGTASMSFTGTIANLNAALNGLTFTPTPFTYGPVGLGISINDQGNTGSGGPLSANAGVAITVDPVNTAPTLTAANAMTDINENDTANPGTLVSDLISGQATDPDSGTVLGIAITNVDNTNGSWEYSTNGGTTWNAVGSPTPATALLLVGDANTYVRFVPNAYYWGTVTNGLTFVAWDQFTGAAGGTADTSASGGATAFSTTSGSTSIIVHEINQPPVNTVPGAQAVADATPLVFSAGNGNAISVSDIDAYGGVEQVSLSVSQGMLTLSGTAGLAFTAGADGTASMTIRGTLANLNAALSGLTYVATAYYHGGDTLSIVTNDLGHTGWGGPRTDSSTIAISVTHTNVAPVNTVPAAQAVADATPLVFSTAGGNGVSVSDADSLGGVEQVTLNVTQGTLTLSGTAGLVFIAGANGTAMMTVQGTLAAINTALDGLTYVSAVYYNAADTLTVTSNDLGNSGVGGPLATTDVVTINVTHTNIAPVNTVPGAQAVADATALVFSPAGGNGVSVSDADSLGGIEQVTLGVSQGTLTLSGTAGLVFIAGANGTAAMTLQGTLTAINTALNGLTYVAAVYYNGPDTLTIVANDLGNSGIGGPLAATNTVDIAVTHTNVAPVLVVPPAQAIGDAHPLVFSIAAGKGISMTDADSLGGVEELSLGVLHGTLTLSGTAGLTFTAGANGTATMTIHGTIANINAALNGLTYVSAQYYNGAEALSLAANDLGLSGVGGPKSAAGTVAIAVTHVNQPPSIDAPTVQVAMPPKLVFSTANGNAITVDDIDAAGGQLRVDLTATGGLITLGSLSGITVLTGTGTLDAAVSFRGTLAAISTALNGLAFIPHAANGTLTITVNDEGNTGAGGPREATAAVSIAQKPITPIPGPGPGPDPDPDDPGPTPVNPPRPPGVIPPPLAPVTPRNVDPGTTPPRHRHTIVIAPPEAVHATTLDTVAESITFLAPDVHIIPMKPPAARPRVRHVVFRHATQPDASLAAISFDSMRQQLSSAIDGPPWMIGTAAGLTTVFTVGYLMWALRAGYLITSVLSALPLWRSLDMLPVLNAAKPVAEKDTDTADSQIDAMLT